MKKLLFILIVFIFSPIITYSSFPIDIKIITQKKQSINTNYNSLILENKNLAEFNTKLISLKKKTIHNIPKWHLTYWEGIVSLSAAIISIFVGSSTGIPTLIFGACAIIFGIIGFNKRLRGLAISGLLLGALVFLTSLSFVINGTW